MSTVITGEIEFLFRSVVYGACLGAAYDMMRRIVGGLFRGSWWRGLEDLLYWTVCAIVLFSMIREENDGTIRWYVLAGTAAGAGIYYSVFRPVVHRILRLLWMPVRKLTQFVENLLKKRKKSVTLIDKIDSGASGARKGRRHGQIR